MIEIIPFEKTHQDQLPLSQGAYSEENTSLLMKDGKVLGFCYYEKASNQAQILEAKVWGEDPGFGLIDALLRACLHRLDLLGVRRVALDFDHPCRDHLFTEREVMLPEFFFQGCCQGEKE